MYNLNQSMPKIYILIQ